MLADLPTCPMRSVPAETCGENNRNRGGLRENIDFTYQLIFALREAPLNALVLLQWYNCSQTARAFLYLCLAYISPHWEGLRVCVTLAKSYGHRRGGQVLRFLLHITHTRESTCGLSPSLRCWDARP